jgi:hypothetical protein
MYFSLTLQISTILDVWGLTYSDLSKRVRKKNIPGQRECRNKTPH